MGWKQDRLARGWKQQLVWLRPESVTKLESLKQSSGMSYQDIINELIQLCDLEVDEESRLERRVLDKLESYIDSRLTSQTQNDTEEEPEEEDEDSEQEDEEPKQGDEEPRTEIPPDFMEEDKQQLVKSIGSLERNRGNFLTSFLQFIRTKTVRAIKKIF